MSHILIPSDFLTEAAAGQQYISKVQEVPLIMRQIGGLNQGSRSPSGAEVILWIDNSGSMTRNTVGNEYNAFIAAAVQM